MTTEDVKDFISERFKNPFLTSLTFFWLVFNWRIPYLLFFSDDPVSLRFQRIESDYSSFWYNYVFPIFATIIYILVKDNIFEFFEKETTESHIRRKETLTERVIEEIRLKVKEVEEQNILDEARSKNREKIELQSRIDELLVEVEDTKKQNAEIKEKFKGEITNRDDLLKSIDKFNEISEIDGDVRQFITVTPFNKINEFGKLIEIYSEWDKSGPASKYSFEDLVMKLQDEKLLIVDFKYKTTSITSIGFRCLFTYLIYKNSSLKDLPYKLD